MEHGLFDALTRAIAGGASSRRAAVSLLAGGALGSLIARLGPDESADAGKKHRNRQDDRERPRQLHAAGKRRKKMDRKKHKNKDKEKPEIPPLPPGCQNCSECEMCQDGACVPDLELDGVHCGDPQDPRAGCNVCRNGLCVSKCLYQDAICCKEKCLLPCSDGKVLNRETCKCDCPDGQWECPGGACVVIGECCPGAQRCSPTSCSQQGESCSGAMRCQEGCCPVGFQCHPLGSCCTEGPPLFCTCPTGYRSEAGLCVPA